jgi:probable HAF family extracellular repeat protein
MIGSSTSRRMGAVIAAMVSAGALVGLATPLPATAAASCRPSIEDLGDPFGGHFSFADGVNAAGTVAGSAFLPSGRGRAVVWQHGKATNLGVVAPYDESFAHGIGDDGTVVGELDFKSRKAAPFIFSGGRMRILPGLGGDFGYAAGINSRGTIVGTASDADGFPHAVVWTHSGRHVVDLGIARGDESSFGSGINDANVVVGDSDAADQSERPAVFVHGQVEVLTGDTSRHGAAEDVNIEGRIVGDAFLPDGTQHAITWGRHKYHGRDLGTLPGGTFAALVSIDDHGRAVGAGNIGAVPHQNHAVLWPGSGPLLALRPLSGHFRRDFAVARKLGTRGQAVGASQTTSGEVHATVWTCAERQAFLPRGTRGNGPTPPGGAAVSLPPDVAR